MDQDERLRAENETMESFFSGAQALQQLAGWAYVIANPREVLQHVSALEKTYEQLLEWHTTGKLGAGASEFSADDLERIKRIGRLIQSGLDSNEARESAQEIHTLSMQCVEALKGKGA